MRKLGMRFEQMTESRGIPVVMYARMARETGQASYGVNEKIVP